MAEQLIIDHVGQRGDGVALIDGTPVYVPATLPGERVRAEAASQTDRRRLVSIDRPSPQRIEPFCGHFGTCGGCTIQHWQHDAYRTWKRQVVVETLAQQGLDVPVHDLVDAHGSGRRRLTAHARRLGNEQVRVGFAIAGSHDLVEIDQCPILDRMLDQAFDAARDLARVLAPVGKPLDLQFTAVLGGMDVDIRGSGPLAASTMTALADLTARHRIVRLTRHGELVVQHTPPVIRIGKANVTLPPGSFLQATQAGEDALAALVVAHCEGAKRIADLFCGVGPFALRLAERSRILAADSDAGAVSALQTAAPATRGLKPVHASQRDLFRRPLMPAELSDVDAVVFDPPRQGALAQVTQLAISTIPLIVAVSCNVATFARDARVLIDGGYRCEGVTPVDQFRHTPHVELVARFRR